MAVGLPRGWNGSAALRAALARRAAVHRARAGRGVPLAWRNMLADRRRFLRSSSGIGFAVC